MKGVKECIGQLPSLTELAFVHTQYYMVEKCMKEMVTHQIAVKGYNFEEGRLFTNFYYHYEDNEIILGS